MKRIYDAAFENDNGTHHSHLSTFWWVDEYGNTGTWTRQQAYNFVVANPNIVYVSEGNASVIVLPYYFTNNPNVQWIQTVADGIIRDNLTQLAIRHRQGLVNR